MNNATAIELINFLGAFFDSSASDPTSTEDILEQANVWWHVTPEAMAAALDLMVQTSAIVVVDEDGMYPLDTDDDSFVAHYVAR